MNSSAAATAATCVNKCGIEGAPPSSCRVPASQQVNMKVGQTRQRTARQTVIGYYASNRTYYHAAS